LPFSADATVPERACQAETVLETALVLGSMAAILGGSFVSAVLCTVMAVLDALWLGAGHFFSVVVICPYFFCLGWKHSRGRSVD
jgi:hypothetical protein